jgi:cyclopropane fatty-acyl-phospholipid synthase-like methyltransferase
MSEVSCDEPIGLPPQVAAPIPLRTRFTAWWNGYDPLELHMFQSGAGLAVQEALAIPAPVAAPEQPPPPPPPTEKPWTPDRLELVEQLWGEGFHTPGGAEHILELVKPMALDETVTLLELGCGLGGGARTIAKTFNTWVTGIEWWKELATGGVQRSTKAGMEKKAEVRYHNSDRLNLKPTSYNSIFSKEALFTVPDKANMLETIVRALRPGGQLCFTDYVLPGDSDLTQNIRDWMVREPCGATPWSVDGYSLAIQHLGLDLRIAEDMSERHRELIKTGWDRLQAAIQGKSHTSTSLKLMIREAEIWARRMALLRKGEIKLYRFFALKSAA